MSLSSSWKKMNANKLLLFTFLVGLLSLTFLVLKVNKVFADTVAPAAPTSTSAITAQSVTYNWSAAAGFSGTAWIVASSTDRATLTVATSTPTSTVSYTFNGLATNTLYYFGAAGADPGAISAYATSSPTYTLADTPGVSILTSTTNQTIKVTINSSSNPSATRYIIRDTAGATTKYLQNDHTWGNSTSSFLVEQLGSITGTTTIGLATNTLHTISVAAVNGDLVTTTYGTAASIYTLADTPGTPTLTSTNPQTMKVIVNSSTNPSDTRYIVRDTAGASTLYLQDDHTWGAVTSSFTMEQLGGNTNGTTTIGLATNTLHTISVAAVNGDLVTSTYGSTVSIYTVADTPGTVTLTSTANQTMKVIINSSTNPSATRYIVRDTAGASTLYLQDDHTWGAATSSFVVEQLGSINGTTTIGLATNTLHTISVAAVNGDLVTSTYGSTASIYTLADAPGTPTLTSTAAQTMKVTINSSTNPSNTRYIIRDTGGATTKYLQNDHTWGNATSSFLVEQLGSINGTTTIGLATNTLHSISVAAVNGDLVTTTYSSLANIYTLAATPVASTITSANPQQLTIVINAGSNPTTASTTFIVRDTASSTLTTYLQMNHTWGTVTSSFTYAQLGSASGTTTIGLATSTPHIISVAAVNGDLVTSSYSSVVNVSTIPNTPTSSLSAAALTTFTVTINSSTNPTSTLYIVRDTGGATATYLQTDHTWGATTTTVDFTSAFVNGLVSTSTTGLTANTPHIIAVAAVSGDHTQTSSYGATTSLYTLANAPSSVVLTAAANSFTLSWSGDANEEFWAEDSTAGTNSGWTTATSYTVSSINCGTSRTFTVGGRNGDLVVTASSSALSATTNACGGTGSIGGSTTGASVTPAKPAVPAVPGVSPAVPATSASVSLPSTASPVAVFVHTLGIGSKGAEVKQLQQTLRELGFFKHPTNTGLFGAVTKAAVVAFQKAQGFKSAPGVVGPATRNALNSDSAVSAGESAPAPAPAPAPQVSVGEFVSNLRLGSRGAEVRMLQAKLRELGFFNHPTDTGLFGAVTRAAVIAFQKDQGFSSAPGVVGPATRAALNSL